MATTDAHIISRRSAFMCLYVVSVEHRVFVFLIQGFYMLHPSAVGVSCCLSNVSAVTFCALDVVGYIFFSAVALPFLIVADQALVWVITLWFGEGVGSVK